MFGSDPVPNQVLIGSPNIFPERLQDGTIFAAVYYSKKTGQMQKISAKNKDDMLTHFTRICREQSQAPGN